MLEARDAVLRARKHGKIIPAFNIPYLPMVKPVVKAIVDENSVAMLQVCRIEWEKFESVSLEAMAEEYHKYANPDHTLLHLDHIPVIDEDYLEVDYLPLIKRAIAAGFQSVMIDGSRLKLDENISATKLAADLAHSAGISCEAELGAVMGHETKETLPYEEIFASKQGFTDLEEAKRFVAESGCDWLSVAVGSIHGAIAENIRHQKKPEARLDIEHIKAIYNAVKIPLVLHGGSGIKTSCILEAMQAGIAKINVGTEIRQSYENTMKESGGDVQFAQEAVYQKMLYIIREMLFVKDTRELLYP